MREFSYVVVILTIIAIFSIIISIVVNNAEEHAYKQGQIDAINGKIAYSLKINDDKTSTWVKRK